MFQSVKQYLVVIVALFVNMAHSWDIATSSGGDQLRFYTENILSSTIQIEFQKIAALTYDEAHNRILYIDKQFNDNTVCGYDLLSTENYCYNRSGRNIHDLAFDPVTDRVFFTDTYEGSVKSFSLKLKSKDNINGNLLIKIDDGIPRDIVVDSCEGYIYWLNTNLLEPTIERARLDGTEREVFETLHTVPVNETYKLEPYGLVIDQPKRNIYWLQPWNITEYRLYTRALNETKKSYDVMRIFKPKFINVPTNTLAISKDSIFSLGYTFHTNTVLLSFTKSYDNFEKKLIYTHLHSDMPISMIANYKIKDQIKDCEALRHVKIATEYDEPICVHGMKVNEKSGFCKCTPGYIGKSCDVSICENYCSHGSCSVNDKGLPECRCHVGYTSKRCDVSVCDNYCLQGNCSFNDEGRPKCRCDDRFAGERCEINTCYEYCLNGGECSLSEEAEPSCQCQDGYEGSRCEADMYLNDALTILVRKDNNTSTYLCVESQ